MSGALGIAYSLCASVSLLSPPTLPIPDPPASQTSRHHLPGGCPHRAHSCPLWRGGPGSPVLIVTAAQCQRSPRAAKVAAAPQAGVSVAGPEPGAGTAGGPGAAAVVGRKGRGSVSCHGPNCHLPTHPGPQTYSDDRVQLRSCDLLGPLNGSQNLLLVLEGG
jgi:hypothetical protein